MSNFKCQLSPFAHIVFFFALCCHIFMVEKKNTIFKWRILLPRLARSSASACLVCPFNCAPSSLPDPTCVHLYKCYPGVLCPSRLRLGRIGLTEIIVEEIAFVGRKTSSERRREGEREPPRRRVICAIEVQNTACRVFWLFAWVGFVFVCPPCLRFRLDLKKTNTSLRILCRGSHRPAGPRLTLVSIGSPKQSSSELRKDSIKFSARIC